MTTALNELRGAVANRYQAIRENQEGRPVIGWMCSYVPEELIHAAGLYPVRVLGGGASTSHADAYLHINMCSLVRSCLEEAFLGHYDFLQGFVTLNTCDNIRRLYDVWAYYIHPPFTHIITLPHKMTEHSIAYFHAELKRFREHLEQHFGRKISDASLRKSIALYNRSRALFHKLEERQQGSSPLLSGAQFLEVALASTILPREKYLGLLERLLKEGEGQPGVPTDGKPRLLMVGSELDDAQLVALVEEGGGRVVADDLCTGSKSFWNLVEETGDPWEALARRYLTRPPCPRMRPSDQRLQYIRELVQSHQVDGVVIEVLKFCKLHDEGAIALRQALDQWQIPHLTLYREYGPGSAGQFTTRVEAFLERLSGI